MKEFISKGVFCIYLDQYAVSYMFEGEDETWNEIANLILIGVTNNRIICPISIEHLWESSQKDPDRAKLLDIAFQKICAGYSFKEETDITAKLLMSKIRNDSITPETYFLTNVNSAVLPGFDNYAKIKSLSGYFSENLKDELGLMNLFRKQVRAWKLKPELKKELFNRFMRGAVDQLIQKLELLILNGTSTDFLINKLLSIHNITDAEITLLIEYLNMHEFSEIPTLNIKHSLRSYFYAEYNAEKLSDQIDFVRISTGLPVSDILLTDKKRKSEIQNLGLDIQYKTTVYCGIQEDKIAFLENLKQILG